MASSSNRRSGIDSYCVSKMEKDNISFLWTLEDFHSIIKEPGEYLESSVFCSKRKDYPRFRLKLFPNGHREADKDFIGLFLVVLDEAVPTTNIALSLLNSKGETVVTRNATKTFSHTDRDWGWSGFFKRYTPTNQQHNGDISVLCEVTVQGDVSNKTSESSIVVPDCDMVDDFEALLHSQLHSDVVVCAGGSEFPVHKAVLATRSPVFKKMFEHKLKETKQNRVVIEDLSSHVIEAMIQYIYTGRCASLKDNAWELLAAADKYALTRLKTLCEDALCRGITIENAAETLILADMHNADQSRKETISFIKRQTAEVMNTPGWKALSTSKPFLVEEVLRSLAGPPPFLAGSPPPKRKRKQRSSAKKY